MNAPFRDAEAGALIHAEKLEKENEELRRENNALHETVRKLQDSMGENRHAYIKHVEDQVTDLKRENVHLQGKLARRETRAFTPPVQLTERERIIYMAMAALAVVFAVITNLVFKK